MQKKILKFLNMFTEPIKQNGRFFFFMYLLGIVASIAVKPDHPTAQLYDNLWLELFLDLYVVCVLLTFVPKKIRRVLRVAIYVIAYVTSLIDVFCYVKFLSTINPTMLLLASETDSREASEFLGSYLSTDLLLSGVGVILLIIIIHGLTSIKTDKIKDFIINKAGKLKSLHISKDSLQNLIRPTASLAIIALLVASTITSMHNKKEMVEMFSKTTIGQVEHELTTEKCAQFYLPLYRLSFSIFSNSLAAKQINKLILAKEHVQVDSCSYRSPNIVLIIGESYNKYHSQLYGYNKETTPRQVEHQRSGRLVAFSDVVAPWNLTSFVFKYLFSMHVVGENGEWCDKPLFPELFRKAGYHVTFITNQFLPKAKEAVYDFSGGFFLNNPKLSEAQFDTRNKEVHTFDDGILNDYRNLKKYNTKHNLIIFHVMGQHVRYNSRYPRKHRKWRENDYDRPDLSRRDRDILSHYDNATLYNDSIVDQIINFFEDDDAIVVYLSDHGEECFNDGFKHYGRNHSAEITPRLAHQEFDIPFWIWCSHKYAVAHPDIYGQIIEAKDRAMMTDVLPYMLLYLAGIHTPDYNDRYNILSPDYNDKRPRIIKGKTDYDKLMEKEQEDKMERAEKGEPAYAR